MGHIIAIPYWHEAEIKNFMQVFSVWDKLCVTKCDYSFLVVARHDAPSSDQLIEVCAKYAPTNFLRCDKYSWTGHPSGANGMFKNTMEYLVESNKAIESDFLFWFEHDIVPIHSDWLDWLDKLWFNHNDNSTLMMGHYINRVWIETFNLSNFYKPYISGSACYKQTLANHQSFESIKEKGCFDVELSNELLLKYPKLTRIVWNLFDLWFFVPPWADNYDTNKLLANGIKDYSQREIIIQNIVEYNEIKKKRNKSIL